MLDLAHELILAEARVDQLAIGHVRGQERARAGDKPALIQLYRAPGSVAPCVGGVIERTCLNNRPIEEIVTRIVRIDILVEDVATGEFANRNDNPICRARPRELVQVRVEALRLATEVDCLSDEKAVQAEVRRLRADFVRLAAEESRDADRVRQAEALIDLGG